MSLLGSSKPLKEKLAISFFGIRGMGSIYYLHFLILYLIYQLKLVVGYPIIYLICIRLHPRKDHCNQ